MSYMAPRSLGTMVGIIGSLAGVEWEAEPQTAVIDLITRCTMLGKPYVSPRRQPQPMYAHYWSDLQQPVLIIARLLVLPAWPCVARLLLSTVCMADDVMAATMLISDPTHHDHTTFWSMSPSKTSTHLSIWLQADLPCQPRHSNPPYDFLVRHASFWTSIAQGPHDHSLKPERPFWAS